MAHRPRFLTPKKNSKKKNEYVSGKRKNLKIFRFRVGEKSRKSFLSLSLSHSLTLSLTHFTLSLSLSLSHSLSHSLHSLSLSLFFLPLSISTSLRKLLLLHNLSRINTHDKFTLEAPFCALVVIAPDATFVVSRHQLFFFFFFFFFVFLSKSFMPMIWFCFSSKKKNWRF